ncbi:Abi family protein [Lactobacillus amylovorus]|jgi:abortive infection bacteriophage resistance protein|uniref:Abi family protein n=1 Tax=Lactobacillus amylovorus TaxID=1604 RepID=UPI001473788F|nr:Abi family protein [Lactobacillus amylovorus]MCT3599997.1 Abi family protein [Lactobacillus amylovorus]NME30790.1 Abi family protein [Lactobacillus amylovorus]
MTKSDEDFEDVARWRMDFCREFGIKIDDEQFFIDKIKTYGYREIIYQYLDHFIEDDSEKVRPHTTFEEIYAFYQLDQRLKNEALIDLQLFEQTFKATLIDVIELYVAQLKAKKFNVYQESRLKLEDLLKEKYIMQSGRVVRRGDLRSRVRRIKEHYLEPFDGYNYLYSNEITTWVLIKEMSFGVACNFFFLLHHKQQAIILKRVFKNDLSLADWEKVIESMRYFRNRAAHNYSLLIIKNSDDEFLYNTVYKSLLRLKNQEPARRMKSNFKDIINNYLEEYPKEKNYLPSLDLLN